MGIGLVVENASETDWMFNQLADDRDHQGMRIPKEDSFYGKGYERPVYFINGKPQQRGKFMNHTTGTSSTAAKFASAFSLGAVLFDKTNPGLCKKINRTCLYCYQLCIDKTRRYTNSFCDIALHLCRR